VTEAHVIERLEQVSGVTALVGTRLYAVNAPQRPTTPYLRVQLISPNREQHLRGPSYPAQYRFQVDACAAESDGGDPLGTAQDLSAAVIGDGLGDEASGLFGWRGVLGGSPSTIAVQNVELLHAGDREFFPDEMRMVRVRTDFMFHWSPMS
jgi:hypothetical protein